MAERYPRRERRPAKYYGYISTPDIEENNDESSQSSSDEQDAVSVASDGDAASPEDSSSDECEIGPSCVRESHDTENDFYISRCGNIQWNKTAPSASQTRSINILRQRQSIPRHVRDKCLSSPIETFVHFFPCEFLNIILTATNDKGCVSDPDFIPMSIDELYGFLGILLFAGAYHDNRLTIDELFHSERGRPIYNATMARQRFKTILRHLRFDDRQTRSERRQNDKLAAIREVWETFVGRLRSSYNPGPSCTVDEMLTPFRGKCPFRQYIPSKPARYGMKIWWLCDSQTFYPYNGEIYCGRNPNERREVGQAKRVVLELARPLFNSGMPAGTSVQTTFSLQWTCYSN